MTNREMQKHIASELLTKVFVFNQLEIEIYALLKNSKINLALIAEACGMQRNTAYYRLKKRCFSNEDLMRLAQKANEIYKL